jgi:hypothetical protein
MPTTTEHGVPHPTSGAELPNIYSNIKALADFIEALIWPDWTDVTYNGSWTDLAGGYEESSYRKIGDIVYLRGAAKHATAGTTGIIFTLPVGYRPTKSRLWRVPAGAGGVADLEITSGGVVNINTYRLSGTAASIFFDSISFDTAA